MGKRVAILLLVVAVIGAGVVVGTTLLPRLRADSEQAETPATAEETPEERVIVQEEQLHPVTMAEAATHTSTGEDGLTVTAPEAFLEREELGTVRSEIAKLEETGVEVSVALVDLETRRGLWYDADASHYPASSIKAAYCTWICEGHGGSGGMADSMASCLLYSSNDDYHALLDAFGLSAYAAWLGEKGAPQAASTGGSYYYPYTTANELASIWQEIHRYGTSGEAGSEELVGYLSQTTSTPLGETLRESYEVWSKAGWYPADGTGLQSTNDAGVVFSDTGTYVVVIMTNMSSNLDGLKPLIAALDEAHDVMCGDEVAYYE